MVNVIWENVFEYMTAHIYFIMLRKWSALHAQCIVFYDFAIKKKHMSHSSSTLQLSSTFQLLSQLRFWDRLCFSTICTICLELSTPLQYVWTMEFEQANFWRYLEIKWNSATHSFINRMNAKLLIVAATQQCEPIKKINSPRFWNNQQLVHCSVLFPA